MNGDIFILQIYYQQNWQSLWACGLLRNFVRSSVRAYSKVYFSIFSHIKDTSVKEKAWETSATYGAKLSNIDIKMAKLSDR